eukprot:gene7513-8791_t
MADQFLVKWINSFDGLSEGCNSISDLSDGVLLYEICNQISPKYFESTLVSKQDAKDNWVLREENVKNLLDSLDSYYSSELGLNDQTSGINIELVAKDQKDGEIVKIAELLVGLVIECENKAEYIEKMQRLEPDVQEHLMTIIGDHQEKMGAADHSRTSFSGEDDGETKSHKDNGSDERFAMYEGQIDQLQKEKSNFQEQIEELTLTVNQYDQEKSDLSREKERILGVCQDLQQSLESTQKQLDDQKAQSSSNVMNDHRIKEEIHTLQLQVEDRDKQIHDLKRKIDDGSKFSNENRELRDEIDILREKVINAEATEEKLKKFQQKIEEISELKKQMRTMEDNNDNYLQQVLDLEEQLKKSVSFKSQLDTSKQQLLSLKIDNSKLEISLKSITEDRDKLVATVSQLELDHSSLSSQLESKTKKLEELEQDNESKYTRQSSEAVNELNALNKKQSEEIEQLKQQIETLNATITTKTNQLEESTKQMDELRKQLVEVYSKTSEATNTHDSIELKEQNSTLLAEKERLEGYLRAARKMIKELREKNKENQVKDSQITEKDDYIIKLESVIKQKEERIEMVTKQLKEGKESYQRELNLMLTAFLNIGLEFESLKMKNSDSKEPRSFLNKKRGDVGY